MSLTSCPSDALSIITSFLNNRSSSQLLRTCRSFKEHGNTFGYLTHMSFDLITDTMTFLRRFCKHQETIRSVYIRGIDNPQLWMPRYVERMVFDHCCVIKRINPPKPVYVTKYLKIADYHRSKFRTQVRINWEQFPNLEDVVLYVYDIDLEGLDLKKLKSYNINTSLNRHLKKFRTDVPKHNTHFLTHT